MKKLLISAAFVAAIATPAFAQSYNPEYGTANIAPVAGAQQQQQFGEQSYAYEPRQVRVQRQDWRAHRNARPSIDAPVPQDENY